MKCRIEISEFEIQLPIGCSENERASPQPICLQAVVRSPEKFPASRTDRLADTLDAGGIRGALAQTAAAARVETLERLGELLEAELRRRFAAPGTDWEVSIRKPRYGWTYVHAWSA